MQFRFQRKGARYEARTTALLTRWARVLSMSWIWWEMSGSGPTNTRTITPAPRFCAVAATSHKDRSGIYRKRIATISTESSC
jgi:hypothetical protein